MESEYHWGRLWETKNQAPSCPNRCSWLDATVTADQVSPTSGQPNCTLLRIEIHKKASPKVGLDERFLFSSRIPSGRIHRSTGLRSCTVVHQRSANLTRCMLKLHQSPQHPWCCKLKSKYAVLTVSPCTRKKVWIPSFLWECGFEGNSQSKVTMPL